MPSYYISGDKNISPIDKKYKKIENLDLYFEILSKIWDKDTCAPRLRDKYNKDNITCGQCSVTAFLTQDIFGGDVYGISLEDGNFHCFNKVNDTVFDLTCDQFKEKKLDYTKNTLQKREEHFKKKEKEERYLLLKERLINYLGDSYES